MTYVQNNKIYAQKSQKGKELINLALQNNVLLVYILLQCGIYWIACYNSNQYFIQFCIKY